MTASSTVWVVTGATRGLGLEFCTQVRCRVDCAHLSQPRSGLLCFKGATSALQILALQHTSVVAGARPGENTDDLQALSKQYVGRLMIVEVELLDKNSVKVWTFDFGPEVLDLAAHDSPFMWLLDAGSYATGTRHTSTRD